MSKSYSPANYAPVETRNLKHSPNCVFYVNGDSFFPGSRLCISNRIRTFDGVKDELTKSLFKNGVSVGHVRNIYTPVGGSKVDSLDDLKDGEHYVAALNDRFKPLPYREIPERRRLPRHKGYKKIDFEKIYTPVQHALEERLRKKSGRSYYLNEHRRGLRLRVHINGYNERPSCPVSIRYNDKDNFMKILQEIETTLNTQPIKKVYKINNQGGYAENFNEVTDAAELQHDDHILILPNNDHKLQVKMYLLEGKNNFKVTTSPRAGQYYLYPSFPPERSTPFKHNKSLNKHKPLPSIGSSKQSEAMSPLSNPPGSTGGRSVKNNNGKPKGAKQIDYDKDEGGVYRAKKQNNARGAQQVNDTRETHVEKPIDQMEAEIVEEEQIKEHKEKTTPIPPGTELNKQPSKEIKQNSENGSQTKKTSEVKKGGKAPSVLPPILDEANKESDNVKTDDKNKVKEGHVKETVDKIEKNIKQNEEQKMEATPKDLKTDDVNEELQRVTTPTDSKSKDEKANQPPSSTPPAEGKVSRASGPDKERVNEDAAMNRIDEYDDSFNRYDQNTSGAMTKDPRSSTPASRGEARRKQQQKEQEAAAKIQAGARGYKARKEYKAKKEAMNQQQENELRQQEKREREEEERQMREEQEREREAAQHQKKGMDEDMAASKIQAGFKGYKQRKEYNLKKQQVRESPKDIQKFKKMSDNEAASKIQSGFRGYKVRKEYKELKGKKEVKDVKKTDINKYEKKDDEARKQAAVKIQSGFRGYKVRKEYQEKKKSTKPKTEPKTDSVSKTKMSDDKAAVTIQAGFKGYKTRKEYAEKKKAESEIKAANKTDNDKKNEEAAKKIQASYRGYKVRKEYSEKKKEKDVQASATNIQASFRGFKERKKSPVKKEPQLPDQAPSPKPDTDKDELEKAATKIQSGFRGYKTRKEFKAKVINEHVMEADQDQLPDSAVSRISVKKGQFRPDSRGYNASKIQSAFRVYKMKKVLDEGGDIFGKDKFTVHTEDVGKIIAAYRGYITRQTEKELTERKTRAAIKIQAHYRGYKFRQTKFYPIRSVNFIHAAVRGYITRKINNIQTLARAKVMSVVNGDKYASIIQALCRGFLTRHYVKTRRQKQKSATSQGPTYSETDESKREPETEKTYWKDTNIKMYSDKTLRRAAATIQSAINAFKTRKFYSERKNDRHAVNKKTKLDRKVVASDPNLNIHANFRGYLNRKREINRTGKKESEIAEQDNKEKESRGSTKGEAEDDMNVKDGKSVIAMNFIDKEVAFLDGSKSMPRPPSSSRPVSARPQSSRVIRPGSARPGSRPMSGRPVSGRASSARPFSGQTRASSRQERLNENDDAKLVGFEQPDMDRIAMIKEDNLRSSTRLSETANSLKSETLLSLSDSNKERGKGSAKSFSTWKSSEKMKSSGGEVEREGESLREIEDDAGELSSIEKNVNAVSQLQAAFRAYRLRREISELMSGGAELMDIKNVDRAVSALKKDFRLRSAKVRRLGSLQFGREKVSSPGQNWWENTDDNEEDNSQDFVKKRTGGDDIFSDSGSSKSDNSPRQHDLDESGELQNVAKETNDINKIPEETIHSAKIRAAMKGYTVRRELKIKSERDEAKQHIEAAYKGFRRRTTENGIKSKKSSAHSKNDRDRASSGKSGRTVFHVQMHSDVINERCTQLQAAFAAYQTRKVFMSLTKLVEMSEKSDHDTSGQKFERMGSLSETDDFKLRHKSIAKIQAAYESHRMAHEARVGQQMSSKGEQMPSFLNKHMVLPPIPQSIQVGQGSIKRPRSGYTRSEMEVIDLLDGKSKTQPDLHQKYGHPQGLKNLSNIEIYIRKQSAATFLQSCAKGYLIRLKVKKRNDSKSSAGVKLNANKNSKGRKSPASTGRKTPGSVASKSSKVNFNDRETGKKKDHQARHKEDKTMSDVMRQRTASIKLEAERRKVIAEKIKLKQQAETTEKNQAQTIKDGNTIETQVTVISEMIKPSDKSPNQVKELAIQKPASPERLTPIPSSRLQTNRDEDGNDLVQQEVKAAVTIQKVYRGHRTRLNIDKEKIQPKSSKESDTEYNEFYKNSETKMNAGEGESDFEVKKKLDKEYDAWKQERKDAAVAIQSVWRGYSFRKGRLEPEELIKEDFSHLNDDKGLIVINIGRSKSEIERANRKYDNASMIQMVYRGCQIRRTLAIKASKTRYEKNKAASKIQGLYKGYLTRFKLKECKSATRIQSIFKAFLARDNMLERERIKEEQKQKAASLLQAAYMSFRKRRENEALKKERALHKAASEIQCVTRGFMSRWEGARRKELRELLAANQIQAAIRGYRARIKNAQWRDAGVIIMAGFKSYKVRQEVQAYKDKLFRERKAATRLQAAYRAYLVRNSNKEYKEKMARQNKAASTIQCSIKGRKARLAYKQHKEMIESKRQHAALKIQSVYRGHQARKLARKEREILRKKHAALKIQSVYRGYLGRKIARKERNILDMKHIAEDMVKLVIDRSMDYVRRRNKASERIQATVKGYCTRRQMTIKLSDDAKLRMKYANVIQSAFRAMVYRQTVARQKEMAAREDKRHITATIIQAVFRARKVRKQQEERKLLCLMNESAVKIQALYRGYRTRMEIQREKELIANIEPPPTAMISARTLSGRLLRIPIDDMLLRNSRAIILFHKKATDLQAAFRAYQTRSEVKDRYVRKTTVAKRTPRRVLSVTKMLTTEDKAAILIQKTFRGYWIRKIYLNARNQRRKQRSSAATNIQAAMKGFRVRFEEHVKRVKLSEAGMGEVWREKQWAANIISCAFRSYQHRNAKRALRAEM